MKFFSRIIIILVVVVLSAGCNSNKIKNDNSSTDNEVNKTTPESIVPKDENQQSKNDLVTETPKKEERYSSYLGSWQSETKKEYMFTTLHEVFGLTSIDIENIKGDKVKASLYSVNGAPNHRIAQISFEGEIKDGKLIADYEDEDWEYKGKIELTFGENEIKANLTREKKDSTPLWGVPEGDLKFIRPIETEVIEIDNETKKSIQKLLMIAQKDNLSAFDEGKLTDEIIIKFVGNNFMLGILDTKKYKVEAKDAHVVFKKEELDKVAFDYFGVKVLEHKTLGDIKYQDGKYRVPSAGGVLVYPKLEMLIKEKKTVDDNKSILYAFVDYMFQTPEDKVPTRQYQRLIKLEKTGSDLTIKEIKIVDYPVKFDEIKSFVRISNANIDKNSIDYYLSLIGLSELEIKKEIGKEFSKVDEGGLAFSKYKIRVWFDLINMTGVKEIFTQNPEIDFNGAKVGDKIDSFTKAFGDPVKIQIVDDAVRYEYKGYKLMVYRNIKTKEVFAVYIKK